MSKESKKQLNFEINLLPVISLLAVLICVLMLTTVWIHIGTLDVKQGLGGDTSSASKNPPTVWVTMQANGDLKLELRDIKSSPKSLQKVKVRAKKGRVNLRSVERYIAKLSNRLPQIKTALILPSQSAEYGDVIALMDQFKQQNINEIGISPL